MSHQRRFVACLKAASLLALVLGFQARFIDVSQAQPRLGPIKTLSCDPSTQPLGRDFYFAMPKNYDDQPGKYLRLYIISQGNCNAYVQVPGSSVATLPVAAGVITTHIMPLAWEMKTSNLVENKGIHVWSDDADIAVYVMSHNDYTSDGTQIMPTYAWGNQYVVAAYGSLFEGSGSFVYDYPSEFVVVADADGTSVTINPSADLRGTGSSTTIVHPHGVPFTEFLNAGQSVQYQTVLPTAAEGFDVTATTIYANQPIGVMGASTCPNIPSNYPYCDFVCEMLPAVRTWGETYYTAPFALRTGGDTFLLLGTKDGQVIYYRDATHPSNTVCATLTAGTPYFAQGIDAARCWTSSDPFMVMQYMTSSTWPAGVNGNGDPFMVNVPPVESYRQAALIPLAPPYAAQAAFLNYIHVVVEHGSTPNLMIDGSPIPSADKVVIPCDANYDIVEISHQAPTGHILSADSPVGILAYGLGFDESFGWGGSSNALTLYSTDTEMAMMAAKGSDCSSITLNVSKSAKSTNGISYITTDGASNVRLNVDPKFQPGRGAQSVDAKVTVADPSKPASGTVWGYDLSGKRVQTTFNYSPVIASLSKYALNFNSASHDTTFDRTVTISNTGQGAFDMTTLMLANGKQGFSLVSPDNSSIAIGGTRDITVRFKGDAAKSVFDTLIVGNTCNLYRAIVSTLAHPDVTIPSTLEFGTVTPGTKSTQDFMIVNPTQSSIEIAKINVPTGDFALDQNTPINVASESAVTLHATFTPMSGAESKVVATFDIPGVGLLPMTLHGNPPQQGVTTGAALASRDLSITASPNPMSLGLSHELTLAGTGAQFARADVTLFTVLGEEVARTSTVSGTDGSISAKLDLHSLMAGDYIYRVECAGVVTSGRVAIQK